MSFNSSQVWVHELTIKIRTARENVVVEYRDFVGYT